MGIEDSGVGDTMLKKWEEIKKLLQEDVAVIE